MPFLFIYFRKMKKSDFGVIAVLYLVGIAFLVMTLKLPTGAMEGEENFVGDSEIIALGGASNETKDRPLG